MSDGDLASSAHVETSSERVPLENVQEDTRAPAERRDDLVVAVLERGSRAPILGARIFVYEHDVRKSQQFTDDHGSVRLGCMEWSHVALDVQAQRHFGAWIEPARVLRGIADARRLEIELDRFGELTVEVVDAAGKRRSGAFVDVLPADPQDPTRPRWRLGWPQIQEPGRVTVPGPTPGAMPGGTEPDGRVRFPYLPCDQPLIASARLDVVGANAQVTIPSDIGHAFVELRLPELAELRGRLAWESGEPAAAIEVHCLDGPGRQPRIQKTGPDGSFAIAGLLPGWTEWWPDLVAEPERGIDVRPPVTDVGEVRLRERARVSGQVIDRLRPYPPYPNLCCIEIHDAFSRRMHIVPGRSDGKFDVMAPLQPITIAVFCSPGREPIASFEVAPPATDLILDVTDRIARVEIAVEGIEPGTPVEVGYATLAGPESPAIEVTHAIAPGKEGDMRYAEWRGDRVAITALAPGRYVAWIDAGSHGGAALPEFEARAGESLVLGPVALGVSAIDVVATGVDGSPVEGLEIAASGPGEAHREGTADAEGRWTIEGIAPGPWSVFPLSRDRRDGKAAEVLALPGSRAQARIVVGGVAKIDGTVRKEGEPRSGEWVRLAARTLRHGDTGVARTKTDVDGRFQFPGLAPGDYVVQVESIYEHVDLAPPGATVDFDLVTPRLAVHFVHQGEPVSRIAFASAWNVRGRASLVATSVTGTLLMPRWEGPTLFTLSRSGVPGSGRVDEFGHQRFASSTAVVDLDSSRAEVEVELPDAGRLDVLAPASASDVHATIVGVPGAGSLQGVLRARLGLEATPEGWISYGLVPGLELEVLERIDGELRSRRVVVPPR
jgi:hypothetical protein